MRKIFNLFEIIVFTSVFVLIAFIFYYWIKHPYLTEMQMFLKFWYCYIIEILLIAFIIYKEQK